MENLEKVREELNKLVELKGLNHPDTINKSVQLDNLIIKQMKKINKK